MPINHYSPNPTSSNHNTFFSSHILIPNSTAGAMFCRHNTALTFNLNNDDEEESIEDHQPPATINRETNITSTQFEHEKLFEKPLTPSDVGKLNRLVIPKQHAEKHFPMNGSGSSENGLLLGFEDEAGKPWRFRYSYWNSSQSYVLTKGWSRFVKEKRLDAGDVVLFARHRMDVGRLFIGWRRRNSGGGEGGAAQPPRWSGVGYCDINPYPSLHEASSSAPHQTDCSNTEETRGSSKRRLRLFGVNLEWPEEEPEAPTSPEGSAASSQGQNRHQYSVLRRRP